MKSGIDVIFNSTLDDYIAEPVEGGTKYTHRSLVCGCVIFDDFEGDVLQEIKRAIAQALANAQQG